MATQMRESRMAVRQYLSAQWSTMVAVLGDPDDDTDPEQDDARQKFSDFEKVLSFPYNRKLAWFPADKEPRRSDSGDESQSLTTRAMGVFGNGALIAERSVKPVDKKWAHLIMAHHSAMLASLYARQEFIRAAARMPMTLFIGPSLQNIFEDVKKTREELLSPEKFSRVVFSHVYVPVQLTGKLTEYVAVAELSRAYPQTAVVRAWYTGPLRLGRVVRHIQFRWKELAGPKPDRKPDIRVIVQRGEEADKGIHLFTKALENDDTVGFYVKQADSRAAMWANVIALTASDNHGDASLFEDGNEKLWEIEGSRKKDAGLEGWQWMAAMLALRRIPYIVKTDREEDANREQLPHPLTQAEAMAVKRMMSQIVQARGGAQGTNSRGPLSEEKFRSSSSSQNQVTFEDEKQQQWWG